MRVLMVNRADARHVAGGDVIQMQKTRAELQALGVSVDVRLADELEGAWDYDLVHIFNIQSAGESWRACQAAKNKGLPVALSPVYWNLSALWYWTNPQLNPIWRMVRTSLGKWGYPVYARWQQLRSRSSEAWPIQQKILLAADIILPNSHLEAAEICKDFDLAGESRPFAVVPNAIDKQIFEDAAAPSQDIKSLLGYENFVLQVGRLSPEKNCISLIKALWKTDVPIVFIGKASPYAPEYAEKCRKHGRQRGKVHFVDWVLHEQLPGVYSRAAVHALPSWRETPGLVSLEAAAAGCRIVSTSIGSACEYFGDDAWYCHPADLGSIKNAVLRAFNARPSARLRQRIMNNYTWDKTAESTLAAYRSILEQ